MLIRRPRPDLGSYEARYVNRDGQIVFMPISDKYWKPYYYALTIRKDYPYNYISPKFLENFKSYGVIC